MNILKKYKVEIDACSICIKECLPRSILYHQVFKSPLPYVHTHRHNRNQITLFSQKGMGHNPEPLCSEKCVCKPNVCIMLIVAYYNRSNVR